MKLVNEGLKAGDLEGVVEKRFSVDQFKSKMGDDKNILVLGFVVDGLEDENIGEMVDEYGTRFAPVVRTKDSSW